MLLAVRPLNNATERKIDLLASVYRRVLSLEQRDNLAWHVDRLTPICCGQSAYLYYDSKRCAMSPEVMAYHRTVPQCIEADESWRSLFVRFLWAAGGFQRFPENGKLGCSVTAYTGAICTMKESDVRESMRRATAR